MTPATLVLHVLTFSPDARPLLALALSASLLLGLAHASPQRGSGPNNNVKSNVLQRPAHIDSYGKLPRAESAAAKQSIFTNVGSVTTNIPRTEDRASSISINARCFCQVTPLMTNT
jgi:hypothetical protein